MKVSELWLRDLVNPKIDTKSWIDQFIQLGLEVDSQETVPSESSGKSGNSEASKNDTVLTLKVSPNRSDCLCMEGLAREWACVNNLPFKGVEIRTMLPHVQDNIPVQVQAKRDCPRYVGRVIQNVKVNVETPLWLKERLEKAGIRALSPVVDVTNYVMLELGQPLHAFDLSEIDSEINIRMAKANETLKTLDEKTLTLNPETLIIADKHKPLAIAGVIGGFDSAVSDKTKSIFLESAYFDPIHIRRTAKRFKLRTESSLRFEKGIDQNLQMRAIERATELLTQIVGGNVGPIIEISDLEFLRAALIIPLRSERLEHILGISLDPLDIAGILTRLGMKLKPTHFGWEVLVPSFRPDLSQEIDLIEEVARIYGYNQIPISSPSLSFAYQNLPENKIPVSKIKKMLMNKGYNETINYSFISPEMAEWLGENPKRFILSNPISAEMSVMRESLIPGLLQIARYNQDRQVPRLRLFEVGTCFLSSTLKEQEPKSKEKAVQKQPSHGVREIKFVSGLAQGSVFKEQWGSESRKIDFYDVKNDIENLFGLKGHLDIHQIEELVFKSIKDHPFLHPGQAAEIYYKDLPVGFLGALHPALLKKLDLQSPVIIFELSLTKLQEMKPPVYQEISKFPSIRRDIAVIVDQSVLAKDLISAIVKCVGPLLRDVWIFDVYQGKGIHPGSKSVAIGLLLQHQDRTLVEEEVAEVMKKVIGQLAKDFQASLRE